MWNSAKDPQEEKYQQKLEAILEEKYRVIAERSQLIINIIWIILSVYAIILSGIFFQSSSFSFGSYYSLPHETISKILQITSKSFSIGSYSPLSNETTSKFLQIISKNLSINLSDPIVLYIFLFLSIASILIAYLLLWRCILINDRDFKNKFEIEYDPIHSSKYAINISKNSVYYSAHLKDGEKLVDRNKKLFLNIDCLMKYNNYSIILVLISILSFFTVISMIINPLFYYVFIIVLTIILCCLNRLIFNMEKNL